jgi:hypothetical protein
MNLELSNSLEKIQDNIAASFLPDFELLSKKALEKGLNYFTKGYIHNIKISEAHGGRVYVVTIDFWLCLFLRNSRRKSGVGKMNGTVITNRLHD